MDDEQIIHLYWQRAEAAISATAEKYGSRLNRISLSITGNTQDAEECTNDTYHAAWNTMPSMRPVFLFAYLAKIARHCALGKLAYNHAEKRNCELNQVFDELDGCIAVPSDEERRYDSEQISAVMNQFLHSLQAEKRVIFIRRYWYADSIAEIAQHFAMSESKVKSMLFRMRSQLRERLTKEGVWL